MSVVNATFGFLLLLMVFGFGFVVGSSPHPGEEAKQQHSAETAESPDYYQPYRDIRDWFAKDAAGFFTFWLFVIGGSQVALFYVQLRVMREGLRDAHDAAIAAKTSSQAVIEAERGRVFITVGSYFGAVFAKFLEDSKLETVTDKTKRGLPPIEFRLKNYGKTPALIQQIGLGQTLESDLPVERTFSMQVPLPVDQVLGPNNEESAEVRFPAIAPTGEDFASVRDLEKTFWFYGFVIYDDTFGNRWRLDFVWHHSAISNGFRTYSYRETQQPKTDC